MRTMTTIYIYVDDFWNAIIGTLYCTTVLLFANSDAIREQVYIVLHAVRVQLKNG